MSNRFAGSSANGLEHELQELDQGSGYSRQEMYDSHRLRPSSRKLDTLVSRMQGRSLRPSPR